MRTEKNWISTAEKKKYFLVATFGNENRKKGISTGEKKKEILMVKFGQKKQC